MSNVNTTKEKKREAAARESFSGRPLTNRQYDDADAVVGIVARRIQSTGAFKEPLHDWHKPRKLRLR